VEEVVAEDEKAPEEGSIGPMASGKVMTWGWVAGRRFRE
jgi:hypothetical protein